MVIMPEGWTILLPRALTLVIKGLPQSNPSFPPFPSCPPALFPDRGGMVGWSVAADGIGGMLASSPG